MIKDRYDGSVGKEAIHAKNRQNRFQMEHNANNQFVKKVQNEQGKHAGVPPKLKEEAMHFNAYMCNNGAHAQALAEEITMGLDKVAFPVK